MMMQCFIMDSLMIHFVMGRLIDDTFHYGQADDTFRYGQADR